MNVASRNHLDSSVEKDFLALVLKDPTVPRLNTLKDTKPEWVQTPEYQWFLSKVIPYLKKYEALPPADWLWAKMHQEKSDAELTKLALSMRALYDHTPAMHDAEQAFVDHVSMLIVLDAVRTAQEGFSRTKSAALAIDQISEAIISAKRINTPVPVYDYFSNFERRREERIQKKGSPKDFRLRLGIKGLDQQLKIVPGTVTGFVAPFKRYKSIVLNHVVWSAAVQGREVALFIYENPLDLTASRLDARFNFVDYERMVAADLGQYEDDGMRTLMTALAERMQDRIKIITCHPQETTIRDCDGVLQQLKAQGFKPEVLVFDYANLIGADIPKASRWEERIVQTKVVWDMQAMAKGRLLSSSDPRVVVTAFQSNMEGVDAERLKRSHIGKSIGIMQGVDNMIGINQDRQLAIDKKIIFSFLVARDSAIKIEEVEVKHELYRMNIAEETVEFWKDLVGQGIR